MIAKKSGIDKPLFFIILGLLVVGLMVLTSASSAIAQKKSGTPYYFLWRQLGFGVGVGTLLFLAALRIPIAFYRKYAHIILIASLLLLLLVFIPPFGAKTKGAYRWIYVGPFSFQPSEVVKLSIVVYLSAWLAARRKEIASITLGFLPFLVITGFVGLFLILEPDIGTLGVLLLTALGLFFLGGGRIGQIAFAVVLGLFLIFLLVRFGGYRQDRIMVFLNPRADIQNTGYQLDQALIAIGSGGFLGRGLGLSRQKFYYLPEPAGDAVFAVYVEEFGFVGSIAMLALFFAFLVRGMLISAGAKDYFSQLLGAGITLLVIVQVAINVGALSGIIPLTGIPLPFISYGGSALAFLLFEMGILLQISRRAS